ncbi:MAG TPA: hypothetical protein VFA55_07180 [Candidatus Kapabacteria bacterium]|nr:hypothetical protein [Candidatus Kapabacteria bacterium]
MKTMRLKLKQIHILSAILWANARLQIAGTLYIALPTPKRFARFERESVRLNNIFRCSAASKPRARTAEEKRCAELIARQMDTIGLN